MTVPYQFPKPPQQWTLHEEPNNTYPEDEPGPSCSSVDPDFPERTVPHLISQSELHDLVGHLNLSKIQAEHLASVLIGALPLCCINIEVFIPSKTQQI
jgi:hypothetical protein